MAKKYTRRQKRTTQKGGFRSNSVAILLTTTINTQPKETLHQTNKQTRIDAYLKSIKQWLEKTNLTIVVVENSGYDFAIELEAEKEKYKTRFEVVAFNEASLPEAAYLKGNTSKGASEIYAIDYAYHHSKLLEKADFIVKITGRYYVPTLESYLNKHNLQNYNALRQNNPTSCELLGASHKAFPKIFNPYLINHEGKYDGHVESIYKYRIDLLPPAKVLQAPKFNIEPTLRGGHKQIMVYL